MIKTKRDSEREVELVKKIQKRDSSIVSFDINKIKTAAYKAMLQTGEGSEKEAGLVANKVYSELLRITKKHKNFIPTVEGVQDEVEKLWQNVSTENVNEIADVQGYERDFLKLFGFGFSNVDYNGDVEVDLSME